MSQNALVRSAQKSLEVKSLKDLVRARSNENPVLLIDVSLSMDARMANGKTRIQGLREVVAGLQKKRQTQMIAFGLNPQRVDPEAAFYGNSTSAEVAFVNDVPEAQGGTPMAEGIEFARVNNFGRAVIVSDGAPNDRIAAMEMARRFGGRIDVVFVGDLGDPGMIFLEELAKVTGGQRFEGDLTDPKELAGTVVGLLNGEILEESDDDEEEEEDDDDDDDDDEDDDDV